PSRNTIVTFPLIHPHAVHCRITLLVKPLQRSISPLRLGEELRVFLTPDGARLFLVDDLLQPSLGLILPGDQFRADPARCARFFHILVDVRHDCRAFFFEPGREAAAVLARKYAEKD
ncbi:MAG: hypothetical protein LBU67_04335, partial [Oscillospiraceae bacterium]|nr:hypothetical protein [Oscillospiraceae bacterium]